MKRPWRSTSELSLRLRDYDYCAEATYFITTVARLRRCLFGRVVAGKVELSDLGRIVDECWRMIAIIHPHVVLMRHVVMPNHVHGIIVVTQSGGPSLRTIIGGFKAAVTRRAGLPPGEIWQERFHERVVRNIEELENIEEYIALNPERWARDRENPASFIEERLKDGEWTLNASEE